MRTTKTDTYSLGGRSWGGLMRTKADDRPDGLDGALITPFGMVDVSMWYFGRPGGPFEQVVLARTVRNGRVVHRQWRSSRRDYMTERGIRRVIIRWMRETCST